MDLPTFDLNPPGDLTGAASVAVFSDDRAHRFWLVRIFNRTRPLMVVCMFNPSDADETKNDPTIRTLIHFAQLWGYGGLIVVNLHSYATSQPSAVKRAQGMGIETCPYPNAAAWKAAIDYADEKMIPVVVAWGALGDVPTIERFAKMLVGTRTVCLGTTNDGYPKHPMARGAWRIPRTQTPIEFDWSVYDDA